jgi:hypothetical protein
MTAHLQRTGKEVEHVIRMVCAASQLHAGLAAVLEGAAEPNAITRRAITCRRNGLKQLDHVTAFNVQVEARSH